MYSRVQVDLERGWQTEAGKISIGVGVLTGLLYLGNCLLLLTYRVNLSRIELILKVNL